ncbi:MAG: hypothetical protein K2H22_06680, partial [Muribaculaceae bacterium]|nr:hypothetical protein [Muribaculaceae bacterium]
ADIYGYVPPFSRRSLLALGEEVASDTDPLDWIADWTQNGEGYLPESLPHKYRNPDSSDPYSRVWPDGIDAGFVSSEADALGASCVLLTRPMTFASDSISRRHATPTAIRTLRVPGLPADSPALAILYGSDDCLRWEALRRFDPRRRTPLLTPQRLFWRLLLLHTHLTPLAIEAHMFTA